MSRGRSLKRKPSRSRSDVGDWNAEKRKKNVLKENKGKGALKNDTRDDLAKPKSS